MAERWGKMKPIDRPNSTATKNATPHLADGERESVLRAEDLVGTGILILPTRAKKGGLSVRSPVDDLLYRPIFWVTVGSVIATAFYSVIFAEVPGRIPGIDGLSNDVGPTLIWRNKVSEHQ